MIVISKKQNEFRRKNPLNNIEEREKVKISLLSF